VWAVPRRHGTMGLVAQKAVVHVFRIVADEEIGHLG
jgi:hypothetical protein